MRRKELEVELFDEILDIMEQCRICRLGMVTGKGTPYVVPLNFGYAVEKGTICLYFHSAPEGTKMGILKNNPVVCVEMDCGHELIPGETACQHGFRYASVIGMGAVEWLDDPEDKKKAFSHIMRHQTGKEDFDYKEQSISCVAVFKVKLSEVTGKTRYR